MLTLVAIMMSRIGIVNCGSHNGRRDLLWPEDGRTGSVSLHWFDNIFSQFPPAKKINPSRYHKWRSNNCRVFLGSSIYLHHAVVSVGCCLWSWALIDSWIDCARLVGGDERRGGAYVLSMLSPQVLWISSLLIDLHINIWWLGAPCLSTKGIQGYRVTHHFSRGRGHEEKAWVWCSLGDWWAK